MPLFAHPDDVCMSYVLHCKVSLKFCFLLLIGSIKAFIHAFIPDLFITSTSDVNKQITFILNKHGCHKKIQSKKSTNNKDDDDDDEEFLILD
jgi:hypothetical protein